MAAKKNTSKSTKKSPTKGKGKSTAVRHTPIPQMGTDFIVPAVRRELSYDTIARRAYEIWQNQGGSELDNWNAAENELRAA